MLYTPSNEYQTESSRRNCAGGEAVFFPNGHESEWLVVGGCADLICRRGFLASLSQRLASRGANGYRACAAIGQPAVGAERFAMDARHGRIASTHYPSSGGVRNGSDFVYYYGFAFPGCRWCFSTPVSSHRRLRGHLAGRLFLHSGPQHFQPSLPMKNCLRELRGSKEWSQADLADKVGVSRQTINAIETEKYDPSLPLAFKVAKLFKLSIEEIFQPEEN